MKLVSLALALGCAWALVLATLAAPMDGAQAAKRHGARHGDAHAAHGTRTRSRGGYSVTLREVWGPARMPPPPQDFGPHFDFPPEPLNGGLNHDPYPN
jgi:hypothetical protein